MFNDSLPPKDLKPQEFQTDRNDEYVPAKVLKQLYNVTKLLQDEQEFSKIVNTPVGGISYGAMNKILFLATGVSISIVGTLAPLTQNVQKASHRDGKAYPLGTTSAKRGWRTSTGLDIPGYRKGVGKNQPDKKENPPTTIPRQEQTDRERRQRK